jgi:hypothetical protein
MPALKRWLIAVCAVLVIMILFGSWAFLANRARIDIRAEHAEVHLPMNPPHPQF